MAVIALCVVAQVVGRTLGFLVPGAIEVASYSLLASSYLALAYTLRANEHIRISVVIGRLSWKRRRAFELWSLAVGAFLSAFLAYFVIEMALEAYEFGDRKVGVLSVPLWIPQACMAFGTLVFVIAFVDDFLQVLRGGEPSYRGQTSTIMVVHDDDESAPRDQVSDER